WSYCLRHAVFAAPHHSLLCCSYALFFSFTDPAAPVIYTLSLHDALPILYGLFSQRQLAAQLWQHTRAGNVLALAVGVPPVAIARSEEHTSELQSPCNLVCRLLLEKKKHHHVSQDRPDPVQLNRRRRPHRA